MFVFFSSAYGGGVGCRKTTSTKEGKQTQQTYRERGYGWLDSSFFQSDARRHQRSGSKRHDATKGRATKLTAKRWFMFMFIHVHLACSCCMFMFICHVAYMWLCSLLLWWFKYISICIFKWHLNTFESKAMPMNQKAEKRSLVSDRGLYVFF